MTSTYRYPLNDTELPRLTFQEIEFKGIANPLWRMAQVNWLLCCIDKCTQSNIKTIALSGGIFYLIYKNIEEKQKKIILSAIGSEISIYIGLKLIKMNS